MVGLASQAAEGPGPQLAGLLIGGGVDRVREMGAATVGSWVAGPVAGPVACRTTGQSRKLVGRGRVMQATVHGDGCGLRIR